MEILQAKNLTKIYKTKHLFMVQQTKAVDGLSFSLGYGEVLGLIGPNAAGKTTTLKMLIGYTRPTQGKVEIFGRDISEEGVSFRYHLGYLPEETYLPGYQTVGEFLEFCASLFKVNKKVLFENLKDFLKTFDLSDKINRRIAKLSMGQKRAVGMAQVLVNNPKLILLDEPTVYLDPVAVESFKEFIKILKERGHSVIISSHILSQIQDICDNLFIIKEGKRCAYGPIQELTKEKSLKDFVLDTFREKK